MARKLTLAIVIAVALLCGSAPTASAQPDEPSSGGADVCQLLGGAAGALLGAVPGVGSTTGVATTVLCDSGGGPAGAVTQAVTGRFAEAWKAQFGRIVQWIVDGMAQLVLMSMSWWIALPNPDLQNMTALQTMSEYTFQIQLLLLTASIVFVAVRVANARHHARAEESEEAFRVLLRTVFAAGLFATVVAVLTRAGDGFASWVVAETSHDDPMGVAENLLSVASYSSASPGLMVVVGIVGILGAFAQAVLLVVRQAMLIIAVAVLPVAAAAGGTHVGQQSYHKLTAWIIAFLLFKPVAALAYGIAFLAAGSGRLDAGPGQEGAGFQQALLGMVLLVSTAAVLPALMRLITPAVGAVGSGGSGAAATAGAVMAGATVATGGKALAAGKATGIGSGAFSGGPTAATAAFAATQHGSGGAGGGGGSRGLGSSGSPARPVTGGGHTRTPSVGVRPAVGGTTGGTAAAVAGGARAAGAGVAAAGRAVGDTTGPGMGDATGAGARTPDMGRHTIRP